jgi:hypothetical protein
VETILPEGVSWNEHSRTSVGTLSYDESSRKVTWQIGRLPVTVFRADAEFSVSLLPAEDDRNKIMIVLSGATITAKDSSTESHMEKTSAPKTTKLDDEKSRICPATALLDNLSVIFGLARFKDNGII